MKTKKIQALDDILDSLGEVGEILIMKRGYFIYYNEPTSTTRQIVIHSHICGNCLFGAGKQKSAEAGKNGVWIGPFSTSKQVEKHIEKFNLTGVPIKKCNCTKSK